MWGIGSQAGQDDVIPFVVTAQQCGVGFEDNNLFLTEGQKLHDILFVLNHLKPTSIFFNHFIIS
jgi:hypothetical protein